MSERRIGVAGLIAALLAAARSRVLLAAAIPLVLPAQPAATSAAPSIAPATAALNAGEADKALALLQNPPTSGPDAAQAHNLLCRVRFTLEQFDAAATECERSLSSAITSRPFSSVACWNCIAVNHGKEREANE